MLKRTITDLKKRRNGSLLCFWITMLFLIPIIISGVFLVGWRNTEINPTNTLPDFASNITCRYGQNECGEDLEHGYCWHEKCVCEIPWSGSRCDITDYSNLATNCTTNSDCGGYGICVSGKCFCESEYIGTFCEMHLVRNRNCDPNLQNPCGERGVCIISSVINSAECYCPNDGTDVDCLFAEVPAEWEC